MNHVGSDRFRELHRQHGLRISFVVGRTDARRAGARAHGLSAVWVPQGAQPELPVIGLALVGYDLAFNIRDPGAADRRLALGFVSMATGTGHQQLAATAGVVASPEQVALAIAVQLSAG